MAGRAKSPPTLIETLEDLERLAARLKGETRIAVDIESDSFYVYHEKVCLLQMSTTKEDIVVDPLAVKDLSPLSRFFRDPEVEIIFHAGEYDIICLKRDYGFKINNVFDTMAAARTLGSDRLGLAPLIEQYFDIKLSKKLQRANWGKRPLTPEHIEYARNDTRYLIELTDILSKELEEKGLLRDARDEFRRLEALEQVPRQFDQNAFWHLRGARDLTPQKKAVLKRIHLYREKTAATLDRAPFRVLPEELLVRIAELSPKTLPALRSMRGMTPYLFRRFGQELIDEIEKGLAAPEIEKPPLRVPRTQWDSATMRRYEALREWRKEVAAKRGVNPVVILPTEEVRQLAQAPEHSDDPKDWLNCLSDYKKELYGKDIREIMAKPAPSRKKKRRGRRSGSQGAKKEAKKVDEKNDSAGDQ